MTNDWRELLCRAWDGELLSPAEAEQLRIALEQPANRQEAAAWWRFEQAVAARYQDEARVEVSRERLLAKLVLQEKHAELTQRAARADSPRTVGRSVGLRSWRILLAGVVALSLLAVIWRWAGREPAPAGPGRIAAPRLPLIADDSPLAHGDYRIFGASDDAGDARLSRGARIVSGKLGAQLELGGYCNVELVSFSDVTVRGGPGRELLELHQGGLQARVTPQHGEFQVITPLGPVNVQGTEFTTTVLYPNGLPGDLSVSPALKPVSVSVAVLSGSVWCEFGESPVRLEAGDERVFAGESAVRSFTGRVTAIHDETLTLASADQTLTFAVPPDEEVLALEIGGLLLGETIKLTWTEANGRKLVRSFAGEGIVEGTLTKLEETAVELQVAGGRTVRYRVPWLGHEPARGGGPDRQVMEKLREFRVHDEVRLTWAILEGKRVLDLTRRAENSQPPQPDNSESDATKDDLMTIPPGLHGFRGIMVGKLISKNPEQGRLTFRLEKVHRVWEANRAVAPQQAVGRTLTVEGVTGQFLNPLRLLDVGDRIEVEAFHHRGDKLAFPGEWLRKAESSPHGEK